MWPWMHKLLRGNKQDDSLLQRFKQLPSGRHFPFSSFASLSDEEQAIILTIRKQTERKNRNNLTRTEAYLDYFWKHPEVHWAFLAHMVSRNGGWSMTDVKGSLLHPVLTKQLARSLFDMFERSNWLIFYDAYPQLLLYQEARRRGKALFHLLPHLGVSRFMIPVWQHHWDSSDASLLTVALIINEQHYIEQRIVKHEHYKRTVMRSALFRLQTAFDFNQIVFPVANESLHPPRLIGRTVHRFANIKHRIKTGRHLYQMLFHPDFYDRIRDWAWKHPHTGSRADYWPERFTSLSTAAGGDKVYSPIFTDAWTDRHHRPAEAGDWYDKPSNLSVIVNPSTAKVKQFYVTDVYERSINRLRVISYLARIKASLTAANQ